MDLDKIHENVYICARSVSTYSIQDNISIKVKVTTSFTPVPSFHCIVCYTYKV